MSFLETEKQEIEKLKHAIKAAIAAKKKRVPKDPVKFCLDWLGFEPTEYQLKLIRLFQKKQFVAAWWCRQSGKSHIISALLLWFALRNKGCYIAVVGPSWRQTKLVIRRINSFLRKLDKGFYHKPLKTMVRLSNGSLIEAFPNNPETIRGPTLDLVYCLLGHVKIALSDGSEIPIGQIKPGQEVLTYNKSKGEIEAKRVLGVFRNPLGKRKLVRVVHDFGSLDCTGEHRVFTLKRGYVPAVSVTSKDKSLYRVNITKSTENPQIVSEIAVQPKVNAISGAVCLRRALRRLMHSEAKKQDSERTLSYKPFVKASRIRSIQIFDYEKLCGNSAAHHPKPGMGKGTYEILHSVASGFYRNLLSMLPKRKENGLPTVAIEDSFSLRIGNLVYGRRQSLKEGNYDNQHSQFLEEGTNDSSTMATRSLESRLHNKTGQEREGFFPVFSRKGKRQVLRLDQALRNPEHEIQNPSRAEASSLCDM